MNQAKMFQLVGAAFMVLGAVGLVRDGALGVVWLGVGAAFIAMSVTLADKAEKETDA